MRPLLMSDVVVSSSWTVEDGYAWRAGTERLGRVYRCSDCGERGHSYKTCGLTLEQRKERRRAGRFAGEMTAAREEIRRRIAEKAGK